MEKSKYDVFLSHATLDKPVVEELARILVRQGFNPWLDKWNLIPGQPWQEAIEEALESCAACAVCLGPSGTGPWQNEEMRAAIDRRVSGNRDRFSVIPVLLPGARRGEPSRLPAFLRATTWVEFRETLDDEKALHRLVSGIRGIEPGPGPGEAVAECACPYRGLQVFDVGDALFFFGRESLTEWLLDRLRPDRTGTRFLAIVGPSGSGKSSLARAGLLATLKRGEIPGSDLWPAAICKPGAQPLESLAVALAGAAGLGDSPSALRELIRDLGTDPRMLHLTTRLALRDAPADRRLVVLVDQFEEVFTLCPEEETRRAMIANLLHAATAADGRTVVVLTLRADFYGRCAPYPDLAAAVSDRQILVGPMTLEELRKAIERPAYLAGCELEGGLTDLLLNEVEDQPGCLPLLEHALLQIWQRREGGRRLTVAAYHKIGGVGGALEKHAEEVFAGFTEEGHKEICRRIFLRLVQVDEQGRATRRRLGLDELVSAEDAGAHAVVTSLTDSRLLTTGQENRSTVELAHEALLSDWDRLKTWVEQDREALRTRRRLDEAVAEWIGNGRDVSFLYRGARLAQAEEWAKSHPGEPSPDASKFLAESTIQEETEHQRELAQARTLEEEQRGRADAEHQRAEEQARAGRRLRKLTIGIAALAVAVAIALVIVLFQFRQSEKARRITLANEIGRRSQSAMEQKESALALLLAIKAFREAGRGGQPHLPAAEEPLRNALMKFRGPSLPTGKVQATALSYDQRWMVIAGTNGAISLWHLTEKGQDKVVTLADTRPGEAVKQIAVGAGGRWVLVGFLGRSILIGVNPASGKTLSRIELPQEDWLRLDEPFSPEGRWLLTRAPGHWKVRSLKTAPLSFVAKLNIKPEATAFSPDGRWLAVLENGFVRIGDPAMLGENPPLLLIPGGARLKALAFSTKAHWLVASPQMGDFLFCRLPQAQKDFPLPSIRFEELLDNSFEKPFRNRKELLEFFNSSRKMKIFESQAGLSYLLSLQGRWLVTQKGNEPPLVSKVSLDPRIGYESENLEYPIEGKREESVEGLPSQWRLRMDSADQKVLIWTPRGYVPAPDPVISKGPFAFSSDGHWLATFRPDGSPVAWRVGDDWTISHPVTFPVRYPNPPDWRSIALSPNGEWLATGNAAGESRLWNVNEPRKKPKPLTNHNGPVKILTFRPDGRQIATAGEDGIVRVRDFADEWATTDLPNSPQVGKGLISGVAFLSDGRLAIGTNDAPIRLWRPGLSGTSVLSGSTGSSELVASVKGNRLASRVETGDIEVWISERGELPAIPVRLPGGPGNRLTFSEDGNELWFEDGTLLRRRDLRTDKLLKTACKAVGRNLTEREWKTYLPPSEPYQEREPCPEFPKAFD